LKAKVEAQMTIRTSEAEAKKLGCLKTPPPCLISKPGEIRTVFLETVTQTIFSYDICVGPHLNHVWARSRLLILPQAK
jgi:hypothetical protein